MTNSLLTLIIQIKMIMKKIKRLYQKYVGISFKKMSVADNIDLIFSIHPFVSATWLVAIYMHNNLKWYNPFRYQLKTQKPLLYDQTNQLLNRLPPLNRRQNSNKKQLLTQKASRRYKRVEGV